MWQAFRLPLRWQVPGAWSAHVASLNMYIACAYGLFQCPEERMDLRTKQAKDMHKRNTDWTAMGTQFNPDIMNYKAP